MLTEQQVSHFNTFGFLIFRQLFSPDELKTISAEFEHPLPSLWMLEESAIIFSLSLDRATESESADRLVS